MAWREVMADRFVNPYNFVRLDGCERSAPRTPAEPLTGYVEYTLTTRSPVLIPNTSSDRALPMQGDAAEGVKSFDFFSYDDLSTAADRASEFPVPAIPGSEIRGVVRAAFEAAFHGCLSQINLGEKLYRRTATNAAYKPGILEKDASGRWVLYQAERAMLHTKYPQKPLGKFMDEETYATLREGVRMCVRLDTKPFVTSRGVSTKFHVIEDWILSPSAPCPSGFIEGYLHKGRDFRTKHHESVFYFPGGARQPVPLAQGAVDRLKAVMDIYADRKINRTHKGYGVFEETALRHLVYYFAVEGSAKYLSPACITKEVFENTLKAALPAEYHPCAGAEICPACALFGRVANEHSNGGRIRFTDARPKAALTASDCFDPPVVIPATAGPRPSTVEFYTVKPEGASYWTYDYDDAPRRNGPATRTYRPAGYVRLRGRKFYWHGAIDPGLHRNRPLKNMEARMRPLKRGQVFVGRVYFNDVSHDELVRLLWCLTLDNSGEHAHKIGHAKPYGFGSVQFSGIRVMRRRIDPATCAHVVEEYRSFEAIRLDFSRVDDPGKRAGTARDDLLGITRLTFSGSIEKLPSLVRYPLGWDAASNVGAANRKAGHQWFTGNRDKSFIAKVLPTIQQELAGDATKHLHRLEKCDASQGPRTTTQPQPPAPSGPRPPAPKSAADGRPPQNPVSLASGAPIVGGPPTGDSPQAPKEEPSADLAQAIARLMASDKNVTQRKR